MNTNRKFFSFFAMLMPLLLSAQSISVPNIKRQINYETTTRAEEQEIEEGTCGVDGDNLKWTFYPETGTLEIVGCGAMADFGAHRTPWDHLYESICNVKLSPDITHIGEYAFFDCNVSEFDLPERLESIGGSAFDFTPWMGGQSHGPVYLGNWLITYLGDMPSATLAIEEGTVGIADHAIYKENLKEVIFPKGLKYIGDTSFSHNPKLTSISFSEGLLSIGELAFACCNKLLHVTLPEGIEVVGYGAFYQCETLESVVLPGSLASIGNSSFASCPQLTEVQLGEGICRIDGSSFQDCTSLVEITLPNSITSIGQCAFAGCSCMTEIILPANVEEVEVSAFYGCAQLSKVTSLNRIPPTIAKWSSFDVLTYDIDLYVPCRASNDYNHRWNGFASIVELECECEKFEITFVVNGELIVSKELSHDSTIELPNVEEKEGYTFGWLNLPSGMPAEDIVVYGEYTPNRYLVTFKIGDEVIAADSLEYGAAIVVPEAPEREGHTFNGWGEVVETVPANDVTIEGSYSVNSYLLSYVVDGETVQSDSVAYGTAITLLDEPAREGYTFSGWSEAPETMPAGDVTISGTFTVNKYLVTFKIGDEVIAADSLEYGAAIVAPEAPEKDGYTFNGWGEVAETVPANDVTYEGSYSVNSYLLTYTVDGETVQSDSVAYGTAITLFDEPTKEGYTFSGWSEVPETMPAEDVTISGTFTINKYLVTFKIGDEVIAADSLEYGAAIIVPEAPYKEGHTFNGWGEVAETVPANDLTYEGTYTANIYKVYYYVGEELVHTAEVAYGEAIPEYIYEPTGEGDVFEGWIGETYETMPAHDVSYVANITNGIVHSTLNPQRSTIYDLTGRKVTDTENLRGGVYIINGRKVIVK